MLFRSRQQHSVGCAPHWPTMVCQQNYGAGSGSVQHHSWRISTDLPLKAICFGEEWRFSENGSSRCITRDSIVGASPLFL
jgi:hypothetical protein